MKTLKRKWDQEVTKRNYKKVVWFYDFWSWLTESKAAKNVISFAEISDGEKVLEIACGTGIVFEQILKRNPNGINMGIDLSPDMLKKARKRLRNNANAHFKLIEGDVLNLELEDNEFDLLINNFMIDLMPEETFDKIAEEFYRIITPKGRLVISTFSFGKKRINKIWLWVAKTFPDLLTSCRPISFNDYLIKAGFEITKELEVSQNTFPSKIIAAVKPTFLSNAKYLKNELKNMEDGNAEFIDLDKLDAGLEKAIRQ